MKGTMQSPMPQPEGAFGVESAVGGDGASAAHPEGMPVTELRAGFEPGEFAVHALPNPKIVVPEEYKHMAYTTSPVTGDSGVVGIQKDD